MKPTITLCMIVKNESRVILECLNSVYKHLDYWVISDTGSTDNTKELIADFFKEKNIPGEFADLEWKGFGHNRTYALTACKGKADYAWMIDADDKLIGEFILPENTIADAYQLCLGNIWNTSWRSQIFKTESDWFYVGVLHEYPHTNKPDYVNIKLVGDYKIDIRTIGARNANISVIEKYSIDAEILETALKEEPDNDRYWFYLAQSYFDSGQFYKAEKTYKKRASMGRFNQEVFYSLWRMGICREYIERPDHEVIEAYLHAYESVPSRAESLYQLSKLYRLKYNKPAIAYMYAKAAYDIPYPENGLFVSDYIYKFGILNEISITASYANQHKIGYDVTQELLTKNKKYIMDNELEHLTSNLEFYSKNLS